MFGYTCEECHQGTVRKTIIPNFPTKFENVPFIVPEAVIGVCDRCGGQHFNGKEYLRWKQLFQEWRQQEGAILSAQEIRQLREGLGLSKAGFAALLGTTRQSLYHWEKDDREVPQSRMVDSFLKLVRAGLQEGEVDVVAFLREEARRAGIDISGEPAGARDKAEEPDMREAYFGTSVAR